MLDQKEREILCLFADIFKYPDDVLPATVNDCVSRLQVSFPGIAAPIGRFADYTEGQSTESLEELYTQTFDITPATSLYLGYHLFGETPKRSQFLVELTGAYQDCGLFTGNELADHLGLMLRFVSLSDDSEFTVPLLEECIIPILSKTGNDLEKAKNPYAQVTVPLLKFLQDIVRRLPK